MPVLVSFPPLVRWYDAWCPVWHGPWWCEPPPRGGQWVCGEGPVECALCSRRWWCGRGLGAPRAPPSQAQCAGGCRCGPPSHLARCAQFRPKGACQWKPHRARACARSGGGQASQRGDRSWCAWCMAGTVRQWAGCRGLWRLGRFRALFSEGGACRRPRAVHSASGGGCDRRDAGQHRWITVSGALFTVEGGVAWCCCAWLSGGRGSMQVCAGRRGAGGG